MYIETHSCFGHRTSTCTACFFVSWSPSPSRPPCQKAAAAGSSAAGGHGQGPARDQDHLVQNQPLVLLRRLRIGLGVRLGHLDTSTQWQSFGTSHPIVAAPPLRGERLWARDLIPVWWSRGCEGPILDDGGRRIHD